MRLDFEESAVAHHPRPVVTAIVKHAIFAARGVVSDRGVGPTDGAGVVVAVFQEHHLVRAWPAQAINRLRTAPYADVRFGERVQRMRRLAACNRDLQARRLVGRSTWHVGRGALIVAEGESLMWRPRGWGACDEACFDRKAGRNRTAYFSQPRHDRFL